MKFYSSQVKVLNYDKSMSNESYAKSMWDKQSEFFEANGSSAYVFICKILKSDSDTSEMTVGIFARHKVDVEKLVMDFSRSVNIEAEVCSVRELGLGTAIAAALTHSWNEGYLKDDNEVLTRFGMEKVYNLNTFDSGARYYEGGIPHSWDELPTENKALYVISEEALNGKTDNVKDISTCYIVSTADADTAYTTDDALMDKLNAKGILADKHYMIIDMPLTINVEDCDVVFNISNDRTVIVNLFETCSNKGMALFDKAKRVAEIADRYSDCLVIFNINSSDTEIKSAVLDSLKSLSTIEIIEKPLSSDKAREYLAKRTTGKGLAVDDSLLSTVDDSNTYDLSALEEMFGNWLLDKPLSRDEAKRYLAALCGRDKFDLDDSHSLCGCLAKDESCVYYADYLDAEFEEWDSEREEDYI